MRILCDQFARQCELELQRRVVEKRLSDRSGFVMATVRTGCSSDRQLRPLVDGP